MTESAKTAKKSAQRSAVGARHHRGVVEGLVGAERTADLRDFGSKVRKTKSSATEFLQRAGILDKNGDLAEPYRS